jgi:hypothetical protein
LVSSKTISALLAIIFLFSLTRNKLILLKSRYLIYLSNFADKFLVFVHRIHHVPSLNSAQKLVTSTDGFLAYLVIPMQISDSALKKGTTVSAFRFCPLSYVIIAVEQAKE